MRIAQLRPTWWAVGALALGAACLAGASAWRVGASGACPFSARGMSAEVLQTSFAHGVAGLRPSTAGSDTAQAAPTGARIFGIERGTLTAANFATAAGHCTWEVPAAFARCDQPQGSVVARFDASGALAGWDSERRYFAIEDALIDYAREATELRASLGAPHASAGNASAEGMALPARQASLRYRFGQAAVDLSITNLSNEWVVRRQLRELGGPS